MPHQVVWFRNDLRLHDHRPLLDACIAAKQESQSVIPVYIVDPRFFGKTSFGFDRTGPHRLRFLRESLLDLNQNLASLGSQLFVLSGHAETTLQLLCERVPVGHLFFRRETAPEEMQIQRNVMRAMKELGVRCEESSPNTLFAVDDLPFAVDAVPEVFSRFRRKVEKAIEPAAALNAPTSIPPVSAETATRVSSLDLDRIELLSKEDPTADPRGVMSFQGGETAALQRLDEYFWKEDRLRTYKQTRNGMIGSGYSSKFSPWLALGCLSPRFIYQQVCQYERERTKNDSTYWLVFELLWRDYFSLIVAKHGAQVFQREGLRRLDFPWQRDKEAFQRWQSGTTGYPLIDANMIELARTGFMSNRGRQNVASFLTKNLGVDWRMGAEWFESMLIDYDPCSNYGNWNYAAGVGNDPRGFRWFNTIKQARDYDPDGNYVRWWLPSLSEVPTENVHTPWQMGRAQQEQSNCVLEVDYPSPIVDLFQSADVQQARYETATEMD